MEIINFKKQNIKLLTNEQHKSYENAKNCSVCKEKFEDKHAKDEKYREVRYHCHYTDEYRGAVNSICTLKYSVPKEISIVFHKRSNYDYYFIIKEVAEEFEKQFTCLRENTENTQPFQFQYKKKLQELIKWRKNQKNHILKRLQLIDRTTFMGSSLSDLANHLA